VVAYLGLDPRVYQSGSGPARGGRISKQGSPQARWALVEAARSVAQQPGPPHAFYQRIRARKGHLEGKPTGVWATRERLRQAEKQLAAQAEASYKRSIADWKAASPKNEKAGASVTAGRA
jgi:Transposase IS116/IS110/IS902 family